MLDRNLQNLVGIGKSLEKNLANKGILTVGDFIEYLPRRYEDRSSLLKVRPAIQETHKNPGFIATIIAQCISIKKFRFRNREVKKYVFSDDADFSITAFNPSISFIEGEYYILSGKFKTTRFDVEFTLHEFEQFDEEAMESLNLGRIVPIYSKLEGLPQKRIRHHISDIIAAIPESEFTFDFDEKLVKKYQFPNKKQCFQQLHFPDSTDSINQHLRPLIYEEFFRMQNALIKKKLEQRKNKHHQYTENHLLIPLVESLPFELTADQKLALQDILTDLKSDNTMNRMLQGDVGTGKTIIALLSMVFAYYSGFQSALLVPTEILANQHYKNFSKILNPFDIKIRLLTGSQSKKARELIMLDLEEDDKLIVIGTHALIQKDIQFRNLKYLVIDEQHRFGVDQRKTLEKKGIESLLNKKLDKIDQPDCLSMSATPIPRSLFLTCFGELDSSIIKHRPQGNQEKVNRIKTKVLMEFNRPHAYHFLLDRIKRGEQGYVVFPLIYESDNKKLKSLIESYQELKQTVFQNIPTALVHGKVSPEEKDVIMNQFYQNEIKILFATTVLEVGIDHHNATTIVIESAYQFGLSQLHQLRGRVGRGTKSGYCYLVGDSQQPQETQERLNKFCELSDGFEIAELDLKLRGPGDMLGIKQSGIPPLKFGNLVTDFDLLQLARKDAEEYLSI